MGDPPTPTPEDVCTVCTSTCFICSFELKVLGSVDVKQVHFNIKRTTSLAPAFSRAILPEGLGMYGFAGRTKQKMHVDYS